MRAIASEPRRSFTIRALPLPDSIMQAGKLGGSFRLYGGWASCSAPYPFELFYRLPAVTVGTPTADKICNRSIANLTAKQHLLFQTRSPPAFTYLALF